MQEQIPNIKRFNYLVFEIHSFQEVIYPHETLQNPLFCHKIDHFEKAHSMLGTDLHFGGQFREQNDYWQ
jgi:hypothetical protein